MVIIFEIELDTISLMMFLSMFHVLVDETQSHLLSQQFYPLKILE